VFDNIWRMGTVLVKQWWNGRWGRLASRDVFVWATEERTRWAVEARQGGADGRSRFQEVSNGHEAFALAMRWRNARANDEWKGHLSPRPQSTAEKNRGRLKHFGRDHVVRLNAQALPHPGDGWHD
jgi:hypothetical protein